MSIGGKDGRPSFGRRANPPATDKNSPPKTTAAAPEEERFGGDTREGRTPRPVIARITEAMRIINSDAIALVSAIRSGARHTGEIPADVLYWPIRWKDSEKLFQHRNEMDETLYTTLYFTVDLKDYFSVAQYQLSELYRSTLNANMLAHGFLLFGLNDQKLAELKADVDAVLVKSTFFMEALKTYPLVLDVIEGRIVGDAVARAHGLLMNAQLDALGKIQAVMFEPEKFKILMPYKTACLVGATYGPFEEGQKVFNGVHFKPDLVARLIGSTTKKNAEVELLAGVTRH